MGHKMAKMSATYRYIRIYVYTYIPIYPITLNGYIYSPGKKIEKIKKNRKNKKKLKIIGTISGALARSLIYIYMVVYRVLSIYRVLPGFREFAVFEKSKRFFYIFLDGCYIEGVRALARAQI